MYEEGDNAVLWFVAFVFVCLFGGVIWVVHSAQAEINSQKNQCIDLGGVPQVIDAKVSCYHDLTTIPLRPAP